MPNNAQVNDKVEEEAKAPRPVGRQAGSGSDSSAVQPAKNSIKEGTIRTQTDETKIIKEKLAKEPKTMIMIPLRFGERQPVYETVTINGYRFEIKKGVYVEVPQSVANLVKGQSEAEAEAGLDLRVDLRENEEDQKALS